MEEQEEEEEEEETYEMATDFLAQEKAQQRTDYLVDTAHLCNREQLQKSFHVFLRAPDKSRAATVCGAVCISKTPLRLSISPKMEGRTLQLVTPESFEACGIRIGDREHPSSFLPLCQPRARQLL
ncbi:unnamed protein product [Pleuronectes platessa]|uniref:Uncharacterized protein n=1 Tax=Pleuronectes platessa TaxID=8262 RepID=A0A9N7YTY9_PLEPL|nr:unnamed protein product [Pleuronectes platessa]